MSGSWEIKRLGDVISLEYGKPLPKSDRDSSGAYPVYGANGVKARSNEFYSDSPSIIVGRKGSAGQCNLTEEKFWPLDVTYFVKFDDSQHDLLFLYYLLTFQDLPRLAKGVKPGINRNDVYAIEVGIPPKAEQKRIVAILDEAFEAIDRAKKIATQNVANARELFESYLDRVFSEKGEGWEETTIGDSCILKSGSTVKKNLERDEGDIPYVKVADMSREGNEQKIVSSSRFLFEADVKPKSVFPSGTTIFPKRGGAIMTNKKRLTAVPICCDLNIMGVIPPDFMLDRFLYWYFVNVDMRELGSGASIPQINNYDIAPLPIAVPNKDVQADIVSRLDSLFEVTNLLATKISQKIFSLDELKQSILQKAFTGQLTAKSPELEAVP